MVDVFVLNSTLYELYVYPRLVCSRSLAFETYEWSVTRHGPESAGAPDLRSSVSSLIITADAVLPLCTTPKAI